jgi:hypothetical protein
MAVLSDKYCIIIVKKVMIPYLPIRGKSRDNEKQTDQNFTMYVERCPLKGCSVHYRFIAEFISECIKIIGLTYISFAMCYPLLQSRQRGVGNTFEEISFIFAKRNVRAVKRHPKPYLMLLTRLIDEASAKYFVGQLISATV